MTCGLEYYTSLSRLLLGIGRTSLETLLSFIKASQAYVRSCTNLPVKTPQIKMMVKWSMALRLTMIHGTSYPIQHSNLPQRATQLKIVLVLVRAIAIGMSSSERKVPTPHLLSTLVAWTRSLVSTYLFGLTKDSTGISKVASFDVSGCCAQWKSVTKPRTFFLRLSPHLPKSSTPVAGPAATAQ